MKASVVIPVFNKAPFLQECLDSVFAQSFGEVEVIAVDDGSTDGSLEILLECPDPRLRVVRMASNQGPGLAAQRGIDEATGEYILRVDADDVLMPERFAIQLAFMDAHPHVGLCGSALRLLNDRSVVYRNPADDAGAKACLPFSVAMFQPTLVMRRHLLVQHGIRYAQVWPRFGEDWLLQATAAHCTTFANIDIPLVLYRKGEHNTAHGRDRAADMRMLCSKVFPVLGLPDPTPYQTELNAMVVKVFQRTPDRKLLHDFRVWLANLVAVNDRTGLFDARSLQDRVDRAWDELFHHMPVFGGRTVWAYLREGGRLDLPRIYYLMRTLVTNSGK